MLTKPQIEARKAGVGGSDVPILLGFYAAYGKTPFTLFQDKMGLSELQEENENMQRGNEREPFIRKAVARLLDEEIVDMPATIYHRDYPWMLCHLDGSIGNYEPYGVLEIKRPASYTKLKDAWLCQLHWQMLVADCAWGRVAWEYTAKDGATVLTISPRIERDEALCANLVELTRRFWKCVSEKSWREDWMNL